MGREIVIDVAPSGAVKMEALGFEGAACEQATRAFEQAIGRVTERQLTADHRKVKRTRLKVKRG